ncbi:MAG: hypothetical protein JO048_14125 [Methylobacteriaceae bacterium]|nr:hypothetical protein [Methylobacteriaceae bacterium]
MVALGVALAPCLVMAQDVKAIPLDPGSFYETFLDTPIATRGALVGASIVGLRLASGSLPFDPTRLRLARVPDGAQPICLKIISRDGRYFARARYKPAGTAEAPFEYPSHVRDRLGTYREADMAVAATNCADGKGQDFLAARYDADGPGFSELVVQVRAGDARIRAQLGADNQPLGPAVICQPVRDGPSVGFSLECTLPLPADRAGKVQLSVGETGSSGEIAVKTYSVVLPSRLR